MHTTIRLDGNLALKVKRYSKKYGITQSAAIRLLVGRGLDREEMTNTSMIVEALCINRRLAAHTDLEIVQQAKKDAKIILDDLLNIRSLED